MVFAVPTTSFTPSSNMVLTFGISGTAQLGVDYLIAGLSFTIIDGTCGGGSDCTATVVWKKGVQLQLECLLVSSYSLGPPLPNCLASACKPRTGESGLHSAHLLCLLPSSAPPCTLLLCLGSQTILPPDST
jgi:hypothetical protein